VREENNMKLNNYEEIVGALKEYKNIDDKTQLTFTMETTINIPKDGISIGALEECKQRKISIFHLDGKYYLKKKML